MIRWFDARRNPVFLSSLGGEHVIHCFFARNVCLKCPGSMDRKVPADPANPASQEVVEPQAGQVPSWVLCGDKTGPRSEQPRVFQLQSTVVEDWILGECHTTHCHRFQQACLFYLIGPVGVVPRQCVQNCDGHPWFQSWWEPSVDYLRQLAWIFRWGAHIGLLQVAN